MSDKFKIHPDLLAIRKRLEFFNASYRGGLLYRLGKYLRKHDAEKDGRYLARLAIAAYRNFCAPIIDLYISYLYREGVAREFGSIKGDIEPFLKDADLEGRPWSKVIREVAKSAGKFGMMGMIVDKPKSDARTRADENELNIRPYVVVYSPLQFVNYTFERINGQQILTELILEEDTGNSKIRRYMIWRRDSWELWEDNQLENAEVKGVAKIDEGPNGLGIIPFVLVRNRDMLKKMQGISDIEDIADINLRIYNLDASLDEIIEQCGYPLKQISRASVPEGNVIGGTTGIIVKDEEDEKGLEYVEPPHSSMPHILSTRTMAVEDLREMSKLGNTSVSNTQIESGAALEMKFAQLNAFMSEKAENMENAEIAVFILFALWQLKTWDGSINYPRKFGIRDLSHDIDQAIKAALAIPSRTFMTEQAKELVGRILKDADEAIIKKIESELGSIEELIGRAQEKAGDGSGDEEE